MALATQGKWDDVADLFVSPPKLFRPPARLNPRQTNRLWLVLRLTPLCSYQSHLDRLDESVGPRHPTAVKAASDLSAVLERKPKWHDRYICVLTCDMSLTSNRLNLFRFLVHQMGKCPGTSHWWAVHDGDS